MDSEKCGPEPGEQNHTILSLVITRQGAAIKGVGFTIVDLFKCSLNVSEFSDNEFFTLLESLILQVAPNVCLASISVDEIDLKRIKHVVSICNIEHFRNVGKTSLTSSLGKLRMQPHISRIGINPGSTTPLA
ncbi:MutS [Babesia duncani]|uniref:MutS n=1 Tax=Babesia duncani TaxID=323732 RepID=A0AAD9PMK1_9APIC|nr:MutS [Babesia duncani]